MANVRFVRTTKEKQVNRETYDQNALYFCIDSRELYRADQLLTDGVRVVSTYNDLPAFNVAADGILYFVEETKNGYVLNTARDGWLQVVYAPIKGLESIPEGGTIATTETVLEVKEEILNTVYTKEQIDAMGLGGGVESIVFAGTEMSKTDGVFSIDKEAALDALGINADDVAVSVVESINFAGTDFVETSDGVFGIDRDAALNALGITVPESAEGEEVIIATETVVTEKVAEMSDELKTYIDEQIKNVEVSTESMDGGEFT